MLFLDLYQKIVLEHPNRTAIIEPDKHTTHQELWERAQQISTYLQQNNIQPQARVGLYSSKSSALIASMLGVWMAGGIFVPLDPSLPKERLLFYIHDAELAVILCQDPPDFKLSVPVLQICDIGEDMAGNLQTITPEFPAYLVYSSGSTGQPKGILVSHRGLPIVLMQQIEVLRLTPKDRVLWFLSMQFDASISDIGVSLLSGATLVIQPDVQLLSLPQVLENQAITYADLPPALLGVFSPQDLPSCLRIILIGGEPAPMKDLKRHQKTRDIVLVYGPTEATICTSLIVYSQSENIREHSIGFPLDGVEYLVEDEELWIGGEVLALGYWQRKELNLRKWSWKHGRRYFRTGDRVQKTQDGEYLFKGRLDRQLKIHGKLVAPEEIERCYREIEQVTRAAVLTRKTAIGEQLYVFLEVSESISLGFCNTVLEQKLPAWLIPKQGKVLIGNSEALPLTPTGKIDYRELERELKRELEKEFQNSQPEITDVWRELFQQCLGKNTDINDNFFDIGGDSLAVLSLIALAKEKGFYLTPQMLQAHSSPLELALYGKKHLDRISTKELYRRVEQYLRPDILPQSRPENPELILLTGATGFLGGRVLWALLQRGKKVRVLVRAASIEHAKERLRQNLNSYGLQVDLEQLEICCGDLRNQEDVDRFVGLQPAILFHCAADTNMTKDGEQLMEANVGACISLFRHPHLLINYASTLSVFVGSDHHKGKFTEEQKLSTKEQAYLWGGYAQTKWMAEILAEYRGTRIFRFGLLTGDQEKWLHPRKDWLAFFIQGIFELQLLPQADMEHFAIDITPIDFAVKAFVEIGLRPNSSGCYHINALKPLKLSQLLRVFQEMELSINQVPPFLFMQIYKQIPNPSFAMRTAYLALSKLLDAQENEDYHNLDIFLATEAEFDASRTISQLGSSPPEPTDSYMKGLIRNIISERKGA